MAFGANQQLREDMWDYRARPSAGENILRFTESAATDYGATALDLVNQAAEIFNGMEKHAREADARGRTGLESNPYPQRGFVSAARDVAAAVKPSAEDVAAHKGAKIAEALHAHRIRALAEFRDAFAAAAPRG